MARDLMAAEQIRQHDQRVRAWGLRCAGATYAQIGDALGCSTSWAFKLVSRSMSDREDEPAELVRAYELERLDAALRASVDILTTATTLGPHFAPAIALAAVDRIVKVSESRRKLLGLDIPVRQLDAPDPAEAAEQEMRDWLAQQKTPDHQAEGLRAEAAF